LFAGKVSIKLSIVFFSLVKRAEYCDRFLHA